ILTNQHPIVYISGKVISSSIIAFCQLFILFVFSTLVFSSFPLGELSFWIGIAVTNLLLALCVGGLTALLTAISVRYENDSINHVFAGGVVTLFAFTGGSFFPTSDMPDIIGLI
ncbi:ABC transporter permease, partial [Pseudomonas sp. 2995-1]|uniref:ABC transporter permease n=1 Tax=Pseudomonas sp. 2995-1 TaxID=1712679 RepID=UPI00130479C3